MVDSQILLGDGRELAFTDMGEASWPCVLFCHGAPITRLHLTYLEEKFRALRLRVVTPDRPGYGRSSPCRGRSLADWPRDIETLADALELDRFVVAGHSSGGPYAVACTALLPDRVSAAVVLGGVTDMSWPGAWHGYSAMEANLMRMPDEDAAIAWCVEHCGEDGERFEAVSDFSFSDPDNALFADAHAGPALGSAVAEAFRQGVAAYAQDVFIQGRPWPFDPRVITVSVQIIHGEVDTAVPMAHSRHTTDLIPGSTFRVLPGHGHMTAVSELPVIAATLMSNTYPAA
jgi:pimeloyl-ACP methyl ester carboxylesterase